MTEVTRVARALRDATACHKLNIAALGNAVPQLHVHIIARFRTDVAWPKPVWGAAPPRGYGREELHNFVTPLRRKIFQFFDRVVLLLLPAQTEGTADMLLEQGERFRFATWFQWREKFGRFREEIIGEQKLSGPFALALL